MKQGILVLYFRRFIRTGQSWNVACPLVAKRNTLETVNLEYILLKATKNLEIYGIYIYGPIMLAKKSMENPVSAKGQSQPEASLDDSLQRLSKTAWNPFRMLGAYYAVGHAQL